ncbi:MAG: hypothetical protein ACO27N_05035, partial [Bacteroidia bacterium]
MQAVEILKHLSVVFLTIATIQLSIDYIGGHSLVGPINRLQNAVSFNYYANTEMYDDRADVTE